MVGTTKANVVALLGVCLSVCLFVCPAASQTGPAKTQCPQTCTPTWMTMLKTFMPKSGLKANSPMCKFAVREKLFTPCEGTIPPNDNPPICAMKNKTVFNCCPIDCLGLIKPCFAAPIRQNYCIPFSLGPWRLQLIAIFMRGG